MAQRSRAPGRAGRARAALPCRADGRARRHPARRALRHARGRNAVRAGRGRARHGGRHALHRSDQPRAAHGADRPAERRRARVRRLMNFALELAQIHIQKRTGQGCVQSNGFCPDWIVDNFNRYVDPFWEHVALVLESVVIGFVIAFVLAIIAHRRRWLTGPIVGITGALYTIPSIAAFILLLPLTGRGNTTALIALVSYTLLVLFRNITTGLRNVPPEMVDAGRGMGLTDRQILWKVELPLAVPEILAGLRIAVTTNVGLATLAFFAGAGGLGKEIYADVSFKSNVIVAGGLAVLLAAVLDIVILTFQRLVTPWRRARAT